MKPATPTHILLVDDDRLVLAMLAASLERAGYRVSSAQSAEEAQELLAGGLAIDLAILDVRMPGNGGLFLAQRLRELDHIPFIMLSAYGDAETVEQAVAIGALGFLVKPLDDAQLLPALESALARARELDGLRATRLQLQTALDQERNINVAIGITMVQYRLNRTAAFDLLRKSARSKNLKLADVAHEIVRASDMVGATRAG